MRWLDINIIIRYLTEKGTPKSEAALRLFQKIEKGEEQVATCEAVITEVVYVLSSTAHYGLSHQDVQSRLTPIINWQGLKLSNKPLYRRALELYAKYPRLDFEDVLNIAYMERRGVSEIYSYDTDFDRVSEVNRIEP